MTPLPSLKPGDLWLHSAEAGRWKTTFLTNVACDYASKGHSVEMVCPELTWTHLRDRLLAIDVTAAVVVLDPTDVDVADPVAALGLKAASEGPTPLLVFDSVDLLTARPLDVLRALKECLAETGWAAVVSVQLRRHDPVPDVLRAERPETAEPALAPSFVSTATDSTSEGFRLTWRKWRDEGDASSHDVDFAVDRTTRRVSVR